MSPKNNSKCSQCEKTSFLEVMEQPLCLSCWKIFSEENRASTEQKMRVSNYLLDEIAVMSGLPPSMIGAKYAPPPVMYQTVLKGVKLQHIQIENTAAGVLNFGTINGSLQNIDATLDLLERDKSLKEVVEAIKVLSEAVVNSLELAKESKDEALQMISGILEQARLPREKRRPAVIKSLMGSIGASLNGFASLISIWEWAQPIILRIFP
jgi:hypothetical protein